MRFTENQFHDPARLDFVPREYHRQFLKMIVMYVVCLLVLLVVGVVPALRDSGFAAIGSLFIIIFISMYSLIVKQRDLDIVMNTEYQNMLFAQGTALGSSFYFFVRLDGVIVYSSDSLRKLFPSLREGSSQMLDRVLDVGKVRATDRDRLMKAVTACVADRMVFPIPVDGADKEFVITADPLVRPGGILLVRGREYRDARSGTQLLPDVLRSTAADKLDHMLSTSPAALYTADHFGQIEYANHAFEQLLSYSPGEAVANKLTLQELILKINNQAPASESGVVDFSGSMVLKRKSGGSVQVMVFQSVMRDEVGRATGVTGSILPFTAEQE